MTTPVHYHIVSDGTRHGTHIYNKDTGAELLGVYSITWTITQDQPSLVRIALVGVGSVELETEVTDHGAG